MFKLTRNTEIHSTKGGRRALTPRMSLIVLLLGCLVVWSSSVLAQETGSVAGRVTDTKSKSPLPGVNITVLGTQYGTATQRDGTYRLRLKPGTYDIQISFMGYNPIREKISVESGGSVTKNFELEENLIGLSEVVVTGTRRADRTALDSPVPIDVLSAAEIRQSGHSEIAQMIQMAVPSFNFPRPTVSDGSDHVRPATLRGLGPSHALVLVNGKRRHNTALLHVNETIGHGSVSVDLNSIPSGAIERIEVLRDGAAAQYGSDAIAGVINLILKKDLQPRFSGMVGQTKEGDGRVAQLETNFGFELGDKGSMHVTGEYRNRNGTNRARPDPRQQYFQTASDGRLVTSGGTPDPRETTINRLNHWLGDSDSRDYTIFYNGNYQLTDDISLYSFGGFNWRSGKAAGFFRRSLDDRTVRAMYPNGFLPYINTTVNDRSLALGLKGSWSDWVWDLSGIYGGNSFRFDITNSVNVSMGLASPREFYAGTLKYNQTSITFDLFRSFDWGLASPVSAAVGAEVRFENYAIVEGDRASYIDGGVSILDGPNAGRRSAVGAQVFPGFRPKDATDQTRTNVALYADLESNVMSNMLMSVAGRFENYSDFGANVDGKVAARYNVMDNFGIRAAASTGFRAPALAQSYFSATSTVFITVGTELRPFDVRTFPVNTDEAKTLGAKELKPEKSLNLSAGFTAEPIRNFSLTVDYYQITIKDRIAFSETFTQTRVRDMLLPFGASAGRFFTNAIDTKTQGVDVIARYAMELGEWGIVKLTAGYNQNKTEVTRVSPTPPQLAGFEETLFSRVERGRIEVSQPKDNINLSVNYSMGAFGMTVKQIRFGETTFIQPIPTGQTTGVNDQTFSARWLTDIDVSYRLSNALTFSAGANNLLNIYPDENIAATSNSGIFPYNRRISPFGFNGRFVYARMSYSM